jgi:hypothetical protein
MAHVNRQSAAVQHTLNSVTAATSQVRIPSVETTQGINQR